MSIYSLGILIENNVWVAKLSVSTYLSSWTDSRCEIGSVRKRILIHFNIVDTHVCKMVIKILAKPNHRFAYLCLDNVKMY